MAALAAELEKQYVIGPRTAADIGYRILWQARVPQMGGAELRHTHLAGDAIFAVDAQNSVVRLRASDGEQMWRTSVGSPVDIFRGVDWIETPVSEGTGPRRRTVLEDRVYISTDTECFVLDGAAGAITSRQSFNKLPTTTPLNRGRFLIYGTLGGQIVWHHAIVGHEWRANSLDSTIRGSLASARGLVIAASDRGGILALDEATAGRRWANRTFGGIVASPSVSDDTVYVPCLDQYLWAFDLASGAVRWKYFTQSPLTTPAFPMGDVVLQFIPGEGLVCFNTITERIDGDVRWRNADVVGVPIGIVQTSGGPRISLWDQSSRTLTLVDPAAGSVVAKLDLPAVAELQHIAQGPFAGELFATATDGRVSRLVPKFRPSEAETADAAPSKP
jgi:hypothetical protein